MEPILGQTLRRVAKGYPIITILPRHPPSSFHHHQSTLSLRKTDIKPSKGTRDHFGYSTTASSLPSSSALILLESEKFKPPQISDSN
ncbi:hypothetical protein Pst134EB_021807 [Puccinia striiformis f. sp. tritici]|nr:hypothetical protein Pst134EB_021807 [Puccinia striiformis f. sp. tritici]